MTKLIKYHITYIINFKTPEINKPIEVSNEWWIALMKLINENDFVVINWDMYNKYQILNIKKREEDYENWKRKENAKKARAESLERFRILKLNRKQDV